MLLGNVKRVLHIQRAPEVEIPSPDEAEIREAPAPVVASEKPAPSRELAPETAQA